jgi:hypothetical protein
VHVHVHAALRIQVQLHSYLLDLDWVLKACPALGSVPRVLVLHGDGRCLNAACLSDPRHAGRFVVLEPPTVKGKGVHHSKLVLVRSAAAVALHVTTANLTYTSFAAKTNATWSACFPRRTGAPSPPAAESLGSDLQQYLEAIKELGESPPPTFGVHRLARSADGRPQLLFEASSPADAARWRDFPTAWVHEYDFSGTDARLVATVPPRNEKKGHAGTELHRWGQARLRRLLATVDDSAWRGSDLVVQFSSVGLSQNQDGWLRQMAAAFCPNDAQLPPINIVFPTTREVRNSLEGWVAGHSIPCHDAKAISVVLAKVQQQERERGRPAYTATQCAWDAAERARAVPHMKSFTRCACTDGTGNGGSGGALRLPWVVVGSHNFSKAAWGELSADGSTLLACKAYELSVLVAARGDDAPLFAAPPTEQQRRAYPRAIVAPLPFLPPTPYAPNDTCWLSSSERSNAVTDALPLGVAGNRGSTDHHGKTPESYNGPDATGRLIYGPRSACQLLLEAWTMRTHCPASSSASSPPPPAGPLPPAALPPPAAPPPAAASSPPYALMITGSRALNETAHGSALVAVVHAALDAQVRVLRADGKAHELELISGHAAGVDQVAEAWAEARGLAVRRFLPDWKGLGKSAGVKRNLEMLQVADGAVAVWDGSSPGTRHALEEARRQGKLLRLVLPLEPQAHVYR